jgi:hypothetical protein
MGGSTGKCSTGLLRWARRLSVFDALGAPTRQRARTRQRRGLRETAWRRTIPVLAVSRGRAGDFLGRLHCDRRRT